MEKKEIKSAIDDIVELTKDFNQLKHLWSGDEATKKIAQLRLAVRTLDEMLKYDEIKTIRVEITDKEAPLFRRDDCKLVEVRPCGDKNSYLGIYIGDVAIGCSAKAEGTELVVIPSYGNPAIFIPKLGKVVYGIGSWWHEIDDINDFKGITDEDIDNTWYVKLMKEMTKERKDSEI